MASIYLPTVNDGLTFIAPGGNQGEQNDYMAAELGLRSDGKMPEEFVIGCWYKPIAGLSFGTWSYPLVFSQPYPSNWSSLIAMAMNWEGDDRYRPYVEFSGSAANSTVPGTQLSSSAWNHYMIRVRSVSSTWDELTHWLNGVHVNGAGDLPSFDASAWSNAQNMSEIWCGSANPAGSDAGVDSRGRVRDLFMIPVEVSDSDMLALYNRTKTPLQLGSSWWVGCNGVTDLTNKANPGFGDLVLTGDPETSSDTPYLDIDPVKQAAGFFCLTR